MFDSLPRHAQDVLDWSWSQFGIYAEALLVEPLTSDNLHSWMSRWSQLDCLVYEVYTRLYVATTVDTTDKQATSRFESYLENVYPAALTANQQLREKLLASGLEPENFFVPLRNFHAQTALYREANLPLLAELARLKQEYDRIVGAQTVIWDGEEKTLTQLSAVYFETDRVRREQAYRLAAERKLADRQALNDLWVKMLEIRIQLAANADLPGYTEYRWQELLRFDYTPEDCSRFRQAILDVIVPAAGRRYASRRARLGIETLRPWDLSVDPLNRPALRPYQTAAELLNKTSTIFHQVDPQLGAYFDTMQTEGLLDLENRKGKAPGAYCIDFPVAERPFIFMNGVGLHDDVQTLLHESGHAFHVFEITHLPYKPQTDVPMEFAEVASMAMELLSAPYLTKTRGGFYSEPEVAQARVEHLSSALLFWPYMAVVDGFQHWVYTQPDQAKIPANCDTKWSELWDRFMPGIDYSGMEDHKATGWQRKLHIFEEPYYYVEYGLAQLGAVQVWHNSQQDLPGAVKNYRRALALGGTVPLPELYRTAGARFAFDADILHSAVNLIESTIKTLESD
jgi:oligoendopeptidase F